MRVTQSSMSRNYLKTLNYNLTNLDKTMSRMNSGLKLNKVSDNVADAAKAFSVREQMYKLEQSVDAVRDAHNELSAAEGNLMSVNTVFQSVMEDMTRMLNGTFDDEQRDITADEIWDLQQQVLQMSNAQFAGKNLFGGTNNDGTPFAILDDGTVTYNGVDVDALVPFDSTIHDLSTANLPPNFSPEEGMAMREDPANPGFYIPVDSNGTVYIDVELGLTVSGTAYGSTVDPASAIELSNDGAEMFGFGVDADGDPINIISFMGEVAQAFSDNDVDSVRRLLDKSKDIHSNLTTALADIGARTNFMDTTTDRYEMDIISLKDTQNDLETADLEEESINYQIYQRAWMISLQLGSRVLPTSLFDFMA